MNHKNFRFVAFYFFDLAILRLGTGFGQSEQHLLTPNPETNNQIQGKDITTIDFFGFKLDETILTITPELKPDWTWLAAKKMD